MSEHLEQVVIIQWAKLHEPTWPELRWLMAIPNGGRRSQAEGRRKKAEGLRAGVSDLFLPYGRGGFLGLWIELKHNNNKPTKEQEKFQDDMAAWGFCAVVCWGAENAIKELENYLNLPTTTIVIPDGERWQIPQPQFNNKRTVPF